MSNTTRYDAFLLRHLAGELDRALRGLRVRELSFDRTADRVLFVFDQRILEWSLVPATSGPAWLSHAETGGRSLILLKKAHVQRVEALPDERILTISLGGGSRANATTKVVIELVGTSWNVIALDADGRTRKSLRRADTFIAGHMYTFPAATVRAGVTEPIDLESWNTLLAPIPPAERGAALQRYVGYTSAINARPLLGPAAEHDDPNALRDAHNRYLELLNSATVPVLLRDGITQPYPFPLWGTASTRYDTLIDAFVAARGGPGVADHTTIGRAIAREKRKIERLEQESREGAGDALRLRGYGDLLLANLYRAKRGMERIELTDFEGRQVMLELDPTRAPAENAQQFYEQARKRERAAERVPALIDAARTEIERLEEVLRRLDAGEAVESGVQPRVRKAAPPQGRSFPYRRYRTTGGLEVRVGRSGRANDELTFRHAAPDEIWLHARDVGGAHVVLRWKGEGNPPRQDLTEAAILAALYSKARSSGTVPVDWTRRKYVRKPRRSPPGSVLLERASTLFVEPDPALRDTLRWPGDPSEE